ncbi:MAG: hypothetical protein KUF72_17710 [Candidatus Thiodiazotropha sp. (ex Ctena orbiculata)]|nr:hypothetical protein [Candidatus Thiodiazotropha taylori]
MDHRVILYHKQATSARTRFLKFENNTVCAFAPLPDLSTVVATRPDTVFHPKAILSDTEERLGLARDTLAFESEYRQTVQVPGGDIDILLANITTTDPPFVEVESSNAQFIDLTQARGLPDVELELLRSAYELILGG